MVSQTSKTLARIGLSIFYRFGSLTKTNFEEILAEHVFRRPPLSTELQCVRDQLRSVAASDVSVALDWDTLGALLQQLSSDDLKAWAASEGLTIRQLFKWFAEIPVGAN